MKKFLIALLLVFLPLSASAQVFSQYQVIIPPFNGVIMSTSTANGAKLQASTSPTVATINATSTVATSTLTLLNTTQLTIGNLSGFLKAVSGYVTTAAINLAADVTGILPVLNGGTGDNTFTSSQLLYGNGTNALSSVATTSVTCSGSTTCTTFTAIGGSPITISSTGGGSQTLFQTLGFGNDAGGLNIADAGTVTANNFVATSTATSTFIGPIAINGWGLSTTTTVCATGCNFNSIQGALNAGWLNIQVKPGTYNGTVTIQNAKTVIQGDSQATIIQCNGLTQTPCVSFNGLSQVVLRGLAIRELNAQSVGTGIDYSNSATSLIDNVRVSNFATSTYAHDTANNTFYDVIQNSAFFATGACYDIGGTLANDNQYLNNRCQPLASGISSWGAYIVDAQNITFHADDFEGTTTGNITGAYIDPGSRLVVFENPYVEQTATGINVAAGALDTLVEGGQFVGNTTDISDNATTTTVVNAHTNDTGNADTTYFGANGGHTNFGIGTSTPGSLLSIQGIANFTTATSTFYSTGGINLTAGCYAINGTCITSGGSGSGGGTVPPFATTTSTVTGENILYPRSPDTSTGILAIGANSTTTAPFWYDPTANKGNFTGLVGIGNSSPTAALDIRETLPADTQGVSIIPTVSGSAGAVNAVGINPFITIGSTGTYRALQFVPTFTVNTSGASILALNNNVALSGASDITNITGNFARVQGGGSGYTGTITTMMDYRASDSALTTGQLLNEFGFVAENFTGASSSAAVLLGGTALPNAGTGNYNIFSIGNYPNWFTATTTAPWIDQITLASPRAAVVAGNVLGGIDFASNDTNLTVPGTRVAAIQAIATTTHTATALGTDLVFFGTTGINYAERMRLTGGGNLGIGTTSPYAQLSVTGNLVLGAAAAGGTPGDLFLPKLGTAAGAFLAVDATGKVIATTTPSGSGSGTVTNVATDATLTGGPITTTGTLGINLTNANTWTGQQIFNSPPVGIGTTTPFAQLSVSTTTVSSGSTWLFAVASSTNATLLNVLGSGFMGLGTSSPKGLLSMQTITNAINAFTLSNSIGSTTVEADTVDTGAYIFSVSSSSDSTSVIRWAIDKFGHTITGGTAPTLSSCGTSPAITGDDNGGTITIGSGIVSACTVTFNKTWSSTPYCTLSDNSTAVMIDISSLSGSALGISSSATIAGGTVYYMCHAHGP